VKCVRRETAIRALRQTAGDIRHDTLNAVGLHSDEATALGNCLQRGGIVRRGANGRRELTVNVDDAITYLAQQPDTIVAHHPRLGPGQMCIVTHDPHGYFDVGEYFSQRFIRDMVKHADGSTDGLELECAGQAYRIYQGAMYELEKGEMVLD